MARLESIAANQRASKTLWTPQPGPQTAAYASTADVVGYGGAAGGGKSDLLLGIAGQKHSRSVIFRRVFPSLRGLVERSRQIYNVDNDTHSKDSYNESLHIWRMANDRLVEFGAVQYENDKKKWQGQPHDFIGFDEVTEFPESTVRFLMAWNRTTKPGQECRVIMTFNPPMDEAGEWVTRFFSPWIDSEHHKPAADGELRWFASLDGVETEFESGDGIEYKGKIITPKSRTFFHASLADNPILAATGYDATIDSLPEPLRSLLKGNFDAAKIADPYQTIPAEWVRAAQARWIENYDGKQTAIGGDIARGGKDKTVIAPLHGLWFAPLLKYPGKSTPDGPSAAALFVNSKRNDGVVIGIDVIGVGGSVLDSLHQLNQHVVGVNFGAGTDLTDKSGRLRFANIRAGAYWMFREALDPDHGQGISLPPDRELLSDLCAPKWKARNGRIVIEEKLDIIKRLGRSPDCGDAVVYAWWVSIESSAYGEIVNESQYQISSSDY